MAVLLGVSLLVTVGSLPLFSHLRASPSSFPEGDVVASLDETLDTKASVVAAEQRRRATYRSLGREPR